MTFSNNRIGKPWGSANPDIDIPISAQPDGTESRDTGYTTAHSTKVSQGGQPLQRSVMNQILKETQAAIKDIQDFGAPRWFSTSDNNGVQMNYPKRATCWHLGYKWESAINNNNTEPSLIGNDWFMVNSDTTIGSVVMFLAATAPVNYVIANGAIVNRAGAFADLWAYAQTSGSLASSPADKTANPAKFGSGDGSTTFQLPNLLDAYVKPTGSGRAVATYAAGNIKSHNHTLASATANVAAGGSYTCLTASGAGAVTDFTGGATNEVNNNALLFCIKYR